MSRAVLITDASRACPEKKQIFEIMIVEAMSCQRVGAVQEGDLDQAAPSHVCDSVDAGEW